MEGEKKHNPIMCWVSWFLILSNSKSLEKISGRTDHRHVLNNLFHFILLIIRLRSS